MILELYIKPSFLGPNHYIGIMSTHYLTSWRATSDIYVVAVDILMHPGPLLVTERCLILQLPPIPPPAFRSSRGIWRHTAETLTKGSSSLRSMRFISVTK